MNKIMSALILMILFSTNSIGQSLYIKTFGNEKDSPVIFLHGGPGYNCVNFEATTARNLANEGFFVIVYDRRGEGRSSKLTAKFTFKETFNDLENIYKKYHLKKATLIGHSFGGIVATLFTQKNPKKVQTLILVGAPISLQETFKTIITTCKGIYSQKDDKANLNYISQLENMDSTSLEYSSYCFIHAMQNGFYSPQNISKEAKDIYKNFRADTTFAKIATEMTYPPTLGFWRNERYTTLNLTQNIEYLISKKIEIYGIYGKDDGLYSTEQIKSIEELIGSNNLKYLDNCSHNVFIDQQRQFIDAIKEWKK